MGASKPSSISLTCMGVLTLGGFLTAFISTITGPSLLSNPALYYFGLFAMLGGAAGSLLIGWRQAEQLRAIQTRDQAILASIHDGIIVFDRNGRAVAASPAIATLLGQSIGAVIGHDIETLMGEQVTATDREIFVDLVKSGRVSSGLRLRWGERTLLVNLAQCGDGADSTVAVFHDLTLQSELDYMKNAFVSVASHELRTPLNAILGYTEMLQEGAYGPLLSEQRGAIERIVVSTGQLLDLANNLLDHAQLEAGVLALNAVPFSPKELVDSVRGVMDMMARAKGLKLTSHVASDVPATLHGDRQRLYQVLVNLVSNAIKFTDEGMIHVRVYKPDKTHWALAVSDTGRGIPAEVQPRIFEPFQQVEDPIKRNHRGTGLGLSLVKRLVTLMGGEINVESEVGRGSTFIVVLPQQEEGVL